MESHHLTADAHQSVPESPADDHALRPPPPRRYSSNATNGSGSSSPAQSPFATDRIFPIRTAVPGGSGQQGHHGQRWEQKPPGLASMSRPNPPAPAWRDDALPAPRRFSFSCGPPPGRTSSVDAALEKAVTNDEAVSGSAEADITALPVCGSNNLGQLEPQHPLDSPSQTPLHNTTLTSITSVQSYGALLVLHYDRNDSVLPVLAASANTKDIIGSSPEALFELPSFLDILSSDYADDLVGRLELVDCGNGAMPSDQEIFFLKIENKHGRARKFWCALHKNSDGLNILEVEPQDGLSAPTTPSPNSATKVSESLPQVVSPQSESAYDEDSSNLNKRRRQHNPAMAVLTFMSNTLEQLARPTTTDELADMVAKTMRQFTGYQRVVVSRRDSSPNTYIQTESTEPDVARRFPMDCSFSPSDIFHQGNDAHGSSGGQLLYDGHLPYAPILSRSPTTFTKTLSLTTSFLQVPSPTYCQDLQRMGIRSCLSIPINTPEGIWGWISCYSYGPSPMRISFPSRKACKYVSDVATANIKRLKLEASLRAWDQLDNVLTPQADVGSSSMLSQDLLQLFNAEFAMLSIGDQTTTLGNLKRPQEALFIMEYLRLHKETLVFASTAIEQDLPGLQYPKGLKAVAGILVIPLSCQTDAVLVFLRQVRSSKASPRRRKSSNRKPKSPIQTAVAQHIKSTTETKTEPLSPRCAPWTEGEIAVAREFRFVSDTFLYAANDNGANSMKRLLFGNLAHEMRTPLNAVINYLQVASEGEIDAATNVALDQSLFEYESLHGAIRNLIEQFNQQSLSLLNTHE